MRLSSQATVVLTSKHFAQRQPWWRCAAAIRRSTAAASNCSWTSAPSSWGPATSAGRWGRSSRPPSGLWLPQDEPCPPPSGRCWPPLSPWCWKLFSESSPTLSALTGTTHKASICKETAGSFCFPALKLNPFSSSCHPSCSLLYFPVGILLRLIISGFPALLPQRFVLPSHTDRSLFSPPLAWRCCSSESR